MYWVEGNLRKCKILLGVSVAGALAAMIAFTTVTTVGAAGEPANVIKYRLIVMSAISAHINGIVAVLSGEVSHTGHVAAHARAMHDASLMIDDLFPAGSGVGETRAKPEIWQNWAKFEAASKTFQAATKELARIAETGDMAAVGAQLNKVGEACGGCHKPFRKKKE